MNEQVEIRKATPDDFEGCIELLDGEFTPDGFGFVSKAQVETEIKRGSVWVADSNGRIVGLRIGRDTLWNVVVSKGFRRSGIGKKLVECYRPEKIRVKCEPIGHLSGEQKERFKDPRPFYESLGFKYWGKAKSKNFWQNTNGKAMFHKEGKKAHIHIYVDPDRVLFL